MTDSNNAPWEAGSQGCATRRDGSYRARSRWRGAELNVRFRDRLMDRAMAELGRLRPLAGFPTNDRVGWISVDPVCDGATKNRTFFWRLDLAASRTSCRS